MDNRERETQWNLEQILVYVWQMIGEDQSPEEYPYQAFATSNGGKLLREQILGLVKGEARAAIEGGAACPECTLGPPNWSERKTGYCSYCNDTGLRPKVRVLEAAPRDVSTLSKESLRYLVPVEVQAAAPLPTAREGLEALLTRYEALPGDDNLSVEFVRQDLRAVKAGTYDPHRR